MGDFSGVSRSTANRVIHRVSAALASLGHTYIKFPVTSAEIRDTQLGFYNIAKFPKVIGALDCTHIKIISPGGSHAEIYRNRKGYMSLNVQAICNADLMLTDLVVRWPGSSDDERIFSGCRRNAMFELGTYEESLLVADSGYMNRDYMMMPLDRVSSTAESLYNESQIRTRNPIERLFGIWKRRFPVLALGIRVELKNAIPIIVATGVLHNILMMKNDDLPSDDPNIQLQAPWEEILNQGMIRQQRHQENNQPRDINTKRRALINNYFQSLASQWTKKKLKELLKKINYVYKGILLFRNLFKSYNYCIRLVLFFSCFNCSSNIAILIAPSFNALSCNIFTN